MSRVLLATDLIDTVRRRAMVPDDTSTFTDEDILDIINEEIDVGLLSTIMVLHEEHMVTYEDVTLEADKNRYKIPYRAVGNKLRDVAYVDTSGGVYELSRVSLEELSDYRYLRNRTNTNVFYVEGNEIVLVDSDVQEFESLRFYFYLRPNVLVKESTVGVITSIDTVTGTIQMSSFPSTLASLPQIDFVAKRTPNKILSYDIDLTSVNSNTRTVVVDPSDLPSDLMVGDYVCKAEQSPVANIPTELQPVLAQRAAVHILESLGDTEGLNNAMVRLQKMEQAVMQLIDDRVEGAPQKVKPRHSPLRTNIGSFPRALKRF